MLIYYAFTPNSVFKSVRFPFWLRTYLTNKYVILRYCCSNLCKWNYLYGDLPFFKIQVNHFMAQNKPFGAEIIPKCILRVRGLVPFWVLRHSFLSLTDCWWLYNSQLKTSRGVLFLPPSDAYVRSFLYLLYTSIKFYYTKALSDQASSLAWKIPWMEEPGRLQSMGLLRVGHDWAHMKGCCWMKRRWDSQLPEEKNSIRGQRRGSIAQSFCVIKFY